MAKFVKNPGFGTFFNEKSGIFLENSRAVTTAGPHGAHGAPMGYSCGVAPPGHITLVDEQSRFVVIFGAPEAAGRRPTFQEGSG